MELKSLTILFFWILIGKNVHFLVIMLELFSAIRQKESKFVLEESSERDFAKVFKGCWMED
jgi:hypothetical protein